MLKPLTLLALVSVLFSCETEEVYEIATSDTDFIELRIGPDTYLMNARPALSGSYYYANDYESISVERSTSDNLHALQLNFGSCELREAILPKTVTTDAPDCAGTLQDVAINYTTFQLGGSSSCPHLQGVPTELTGTVTIAKWSDDDLVTGTFTADPMEGSDHAISGHFQVYAR